MLQGNFCTLWIDIMPSWQKLGIISLEIENDNNRPARIACQLKDETFFVFVNTLFNLIVGYLPHWCWWRIETFWPAERWDILTSPLCPPISLSQGCSNKLNIPSWKKGRHQWFLNLGLQCILHWKLLWSSESSSSWWKVLTTTPKANILVLCSSKCFFFFAAKRSRWKHPLSSS